MLRELDIKKRQFFVRHANLILMVDFDLFNGCRGLREM